MQVARVLGLAGLLALGAAAPGRAAAAARGAVCPDCNVILIAVDTLRGDHLGAYGYRKGTSPHIDRLAARGVVFDDFVVQAYLTPVSMMSIFTSQYPSVNGYTSFASTIDTATVVLPEVMRTFGFKTAAFLTSPEFYQVQSSPWAGAIDTTNSFRRGFDLYDFPSPQSRSVYGPRGVPDETLFRWLEENKASKFFVWLALGSAHWPYGQRASEETKRKYAPKDYHGPLAGEPPSYWNALSRVYDGVLYPLPDADESVPERYRRPPARLTPQDHQALLGAYDAGVEFTDAFVGRLREALSRLKLDEKTIIVLLAEHADSLGEHGYYGHYDLYNAELRAPLIVFHPKLKKARRVKSLASGLDVTPTLLELAGIPTFHQAQGQSLLPRLEGAPAAGGAPAVFSQRMPFFEITLFQNQLQTAPAELRGWRDGYLRRLEPLLGERWSPARMDTAVQDERWKLIHRRSPELLKRLSWWSYLTGRPIDWPEYELYDLTRDPGERTDVFGARPDEAGRLKETLAAFESEADGWLRIKQPPVRSPLLIPYP